MSEEVFNKEVKIEKMAFLYKLLYVFFVLYDVNFTFLPSFTTGRIAIFTLILVIVFKGKKIIFDGKMINYIWLLIFLCVFSIMQAAFSNDFTQTSRLFYFTFQSLLGSYLLVHFIKERNELLWLFLVACSIQALITIYAFAVPSFKSILSLYVIYGGNFGTDNIYRSFGLSSSSGAALSVIQSIGVISAGYLLHSNSGMNFKKKFIILLLGILCFVSIFFIGRTGLWISFLFIGLLFVSLNLKSILFFLSVGCLFYFINLETLLLMITPQQQDFSTEYFSGWLGDAFELSNNSTLNAIGEMQLPPLTWNTFIGTGQIANIDGTNASGNDTGYIQTYYSLGFLLTVIFYLKLLLFLFSYVKKVFFKKPLYILILVLFFADLKEPMIFKYALPFFIFCVTFIEKKQISLRQTNYE